MSHKKRTTPKAKAPRREYRVFRVSVGPYDDGSGFRQTVVVEHKNDTGEEKRTVQIEQHSESWLMMTPEEWPALRDAVDRGIAIVFGQTGRNLGPPAKAPAKGGGV
jgi:hypothetical protein